MNNCNNCGAFISCDDDISLSGWWLVLAASIFLSIGVAIGFAIKI
jgi:hypothetical protein